MYVNAVFRFGTGVVMHISHLPTLSRDYFCFDRFRFFRCILMAALASFLWICLMRLCTCAMVYFTLAVFVSIFGAGEFPCSVFLLDTCPT